MSGALEDSSELETNSRPHLDHTCGRIRETLEQVRTEGELKFKVYH